MVSFSMGIVIGIVTGIILILTLILSILLKKEKGLQQQLIKVEEKSKYLKRIDELIKTDKSAELILNALDQLSKEYFQDKYNISKDTDYSEIRSEMLKRGEKEAAQFAQEMVRALYSGKKMKLTFIQDNMHKFKELIQPQPILKDNSFNQEKARNQESSPDYEDIKNTRSHPQLPLASPSTFSLPEKTIKLLKGEKESGEVIFPVIKKSAEDSEEKKEEQVKERVKEKEWRTAFKKESLEKDLPVKLQEEIAKEDQERDVGILSQKLEAPKKPFEAKDTKKQTPPKKPVPIPSNLYSHLR